MGDRDAVVWMDHLVTDACWLLLSSAAVGRVGFVSEGQPKVLPVNHCVDEHTIVFRTEGGASLHVLGQGAPVAFEVDGADSDVQTGWSVLVEGRLLEITDPDELSRVSHLPVHPWAPGERDHWMRLIPTSVTGRAISRLRASPEGTFLPYMPPD
jgi:uncharacterized protein